MTDQPYDADFDVRPKSEKSALGVSQKTTFVAGLGLSVLVLCTIGFFILLIRVI